jgi:hypothetical protein
MSSSKVCPGLLVSLGLGMVIASGPTPAQAFVPINPGTDYVMTPSRGARIFLGTQFYDFSGLPIGTPTATPPDGGYNGMADTVINRLQPVASSGGSTALEIVGLSLRGADYPHFYVGLQKYLPSGLTSTGQMKIFDNTWESDFVINGVVIETPIGTEPTGTDFVKNLIQTKCGTAGYTCTNFSKGPFHAVDQPYSRTQIGPGGANLVVPGLEQNFFISEQVIHDAGDGTIHTIDPVPAPLPILGASILMMRIKRLRKLAARIHTGKLSRQSSL